MAEKKANAKMAYTFNKTVQTIRRRQPKLIIFRMELDIPVAAAGRIIATRPVTRVPLIIGDEAGSYRVGVAMLPYRRVCDPCDAG